MGSNSSRNAYSSRKITNRQRRQKYTPYERRRDYGGTVANVSTDDDDNDSVRTAADVMRFAAESFARLDSDYNAWRLDQYNDVLSTFVGMVKNKALYNNSSNLTCYIELLDEFVDRLIDLFPQIHMVNKYVSYGTFTVNQWGPIYWAFFHHSSILLQMALSRNLIDDIHNFASLVYNVDAALPCPNCISHYMTVKYAATTKEIVKLISFGYTIRGVYLFHRHITDNILAHTFRRGSATYEQQRLAKDFSVVNFAQLYNVYPYTVQERELTRYARPPLEWMPTVHTCVATLLAIRYGGTLIGASMRLKDSKFYKTSEMSAEFQTTFKTQLTAAQTDQTFANITDDDIASTLEEAIAQRRTGADNATIKHHDGQNMTESEARKWRSIVDELLRMFHNL